MSTTTRVIRALIIFIQFSANPALAELSSDYYRALQHAASEQWRIGVERTFVMRQASDDITECHVRAYCRVIAVERSSCGLRGGGQRIIIEYDTEERNVPITGPSPVPLLSVAKRYRVFVNPNCQSHSFEPAAQGRSFLTLE